MLKKLFGKQNPYAKRTLLVENCASFSDSAKSNAYFFLVQLFTRVHKRNIDATRNMPTLTEWYELFQNLKPEFFEKEFSAFCNQNNIPETDKERTKKECLELLFTIKGLIKDSLKNGWDLWFTSDFDEQESMQKKKMKALEEICRARYETSIQKS
jgi:hypothetical protein